jgi:hypothetical protein
MWADFMSVILDHYARVRLLHDTCEMEKDIISLLLSPRVFQGLNPSRRDLLHVIRARFDILASLRSARGSHLLEPDDFIFNDETSPESPYQPLDPDAELFLDDLEREDEPLPELDERKEDFISRVFPIERIHDIPARVTAAANSGRLAKALDILADEAHRPLTDDLIPALEQLYPLPLPNREVPQLPDDAPSLPVSSLTLQSVLHNQEMKAAGPGPSGMVAAHLSALGRFPQIFANLSGLFYDLANGVIQSDLVHLLLTAGRGIPVISEKDGNTKIRPLGPPEVIFKITALVVAEPSKKIWPSFFSPIQFGVGAPGGASLAGIVIQIEFEKVPTNVVVSADATTAFHSLDLQAAMTELFSYRQFASMWKWLHWVHSDPKLVVFTKQSSDSHFIRMSRGGLQGDPLYPFFYSLALHRAYLKSTEDSPSPLTATAYIDDFSIVGDFQAATCAMEKFQVAASDMGLTLNSKSNILVHQGDEAGKAAASSYANSKGWRYSDSSVVCLGMRLGNRSLSDSSWVENEVMSSTPIFNFLKTNAVSKQIRYLLLKNVVASRLSFLMRTNPPDLISSSLYSFDKLALETFCSIFEIDSRSISADMITQIGLPTSRAGFGIFPTRDFADAAFVASVIPEIGRASPPSSKDDIAAQFSDAKARLESKGVVFPDDPSRVPKLQKNLSDQIHAHIFRDLLSSSSPVARSRLLSASQDHAGDVLTHSPNCSSFRLTDDEFLTYGLMRLGLQSHSFGPPKQVCGACGQPLPPDPEDRINHAMSCTKTRKREGYFRHHHIEVELRRTLLESAAFHVTNEPHFESRGKHLRPDMEAFFGGGRPSSLVEVSVTHPSCPTYIKDLKSHLVPRASVRQRAKDKTSKYKDLLGDRRFFIPAVAETYGALGEELEKFVRFHSTIISRKSGAPYNRVVANHFAAISFALQRGNAQIIHRSLFHVSP